MSDAQHVAALLERAKESLSGAESEYANQRFHNCANRAYYACYQAAVAALVHAGIVPPGSRWGHELVQAQFVGLLINRRHIYSPEHRDTIGRLQHVRGVADYQIEIVSEIQAARNLRRAKSFVAGVRNELRRQHENVPSGIIT